MISLNFKVVLFISASIFYTNIASAQSGCTDPQASNYNAGATINDGSCIYPVTHNTPLLRGILAPDIDESSGLVWTNGKLWTHNDSGNPAIIYNIDTTNGHTLQTVFIDNYPNTDWEDITADSNYIYVGNFGNNSGDRTDLKILKILKTDITSADTVHLNAQAISFSYTDQTSFIPSSTHNFDCESVISIGDSLYIFTKDRGDLQTRVYRLPKTPGTYAVSPYTSYNVDGLVTGADYDPVTKEIALVGYMSGHTNSFMWFLNDYQGTMFFSGNKRRIEISSGKEWQTEGVCYISPGRFFVSCETTDSIPASLFVSNESWLTGVSYINSVSQTYIESYPNPVIDILHIDKAMTGDNYRIFNITGTVVKEGTLKNRDNNISLSALTTGTYLLEISSSEGRRSAKMIIKE